MSLAGSRLRPAPWDPWSWRHVRSRRCLTRESLALGRHQESPIICMVFRGVALRELALSDHQAGKYSVLSAYVRERSVTCTPWCLVSLHDTHRAHGYGQS